MKIKNCLLILILVSLSCKKDDVQENIDIFGRWQWDFTRIAYTTFSPETSNVKRIVSFNNDRTYVVTENDLPTNEGTFTASIETSQRKNEKDAIKIVFSNYRVKDSIVYAKLTNSDTLLFSSYFKGGTYSVTGGALTSYHKL